MARNTRKRPPNYLDKLLGYLTPDQALEFKQWARYRTISDIEARARELHKEAASRGVETPLPQYSSCQNWYEAQFPPGQRAESIIGTVKLYDGVHRSALSYAEMAIAETAANLELIQRQLHPVYREEGNPDPHGPPEREINKSLVFAALGLAKELRTGAIALHEAKRLEDRRELYLNGAYRVIEILESKARDAGKLNALEELIRAALLQLESEAGG